MVTLCQDTLHPMEGFMSDEATIDIEDLLVVGSDGKVYIIPKSTYSKPEFQVRKGVACKLYVQPNKMGQVLSKIVQRNIDDALKEDTQCLESMKDYDFFRLLQDDHAPADQEFQHGYWLDVRKLRLMGRPDVPDVLEPTDGPPTRIDVSEGVNDNLFVALWANLQRSTDKTYRIHYLSEGIVHAMPAPESDANAVLEYFVKGGTQVGALTENERKYLGMHGACYIVNLSSFRK